MAALRFADRLGTGLPPLVQLLDELLNAPPVDTDPGVLEITLQIAPSEVGFENPVSPGVDLNRDVGVAGSPLDALLIMEASEENPEVPIAHLVAEQQER